MPTPNVFDYQAIRNTISRYCIALDTKDWPLLQRVFTDDVIADYPFSGQIVGCTQIAEGVKHRLTHVKSQHALTTQTITISADGHTAEATTYFTALHFGQGRKWDGKEVTAWGKYEDRLTLLHHSPPELLGASGPWRIQHRLVSFMGRLGEEGVMTGEGA